MSDGDDTIKAEACTEENDDSSSSNNAVKVNNGDMAEIGVGYLCL